MVIPSKNTVEIGDKRSLIVLNTCESHLANWKEGFVKKNTFKAHKLDKDPKAYSLDSSGKGEIMKSSIILLCILGCIALAVGRAVANEQEFERYLQPESIDTPSRDLKKEPKKKKKKKKK